MDDKTEASKPVPWHESGTNPDYRFSLANERTFLAWIRTALAILAGALVLHQFAVSLHLGRSAMWATSSLSLLSAWLAAGAYKRWKNNEIAMRQAKALPRSGLLVALATATVIIAIAAMAAPLFEQ
jgi:putative membrane protein